MSVTVPLKVEGVVLHAARVKATTREGIRIMNGSLLMADFLIRNAHPTMGRTVMERTYNKIKDHIAADPSISTTSTDQRSLKIP